VPRQMYSLKGCIRKRERCAKIMPAYEQPLRVNCRLVPVHFFRRTELPKG